MIVSYEYDSDFRYGWASIDVSEDISPLIIVHTKHGARGYTLDDMGEKLIPTCICNAYCENECGCPDVSWEREYG